MGEHLEQAQNAKDKLTVLQPEVNMIPKTEIPGLMSCACAAMLLVLTVVYFWIKQSLVSMTRNISDAITVSKRKVRQPLKELPLDECKVSDPTRTLKKLSKKLSLKENIGSLRHKTGSYDVSKRVIF